MCNLVNYLIHTMKTKTRAEIGARMKRRVEGRKSSVTYEVMVEVGWKVRERGPRLRVTSSHRRKTRRSNENVAS